MQDNISPKADSDSNSREATKDTLNNCNFDSINNLKQKELNTLLPNNRPDGVHVPDLNENLNLTFSISAKNIEDKKKNFLAIDSSLIGITNQESKETFPFAEPEILDLKREKYVNRLAEDSTDSLKKHSQPTNDDYHQNIDSYPSYDSIYTGELLNSIQDPTIKLMFQQIIKASKNEFIALREDIRKEIEAARVGSWKEIEFAREGSRKEIEFACEGSRKEIQAILRKNEIEFSSLKNQNTIMMESIEGIKRKIGEIDMNLKIEQVKLESLIANYNAKYSDMDKKLIECLDQIKKKHLHLITNNNNNENVYDTYYQEHLAEFILDLITNEIKPQLKELMKLTNETFKDVDLIKTEQSISNIKISANENHLHELDNPCSFNNKKLNEDILQVKREIKCFKENLLIVDRDFFTMKSAISDYEQPKIDFSPSKKDKT